MELLRIKLLLVFKIIMGYKICNRHTKEGHETMGNASIQWRDSGLSQ